MENKSVVIYKSKYGSAKTYARLIADALNCDLFEWNDFVPEMFSDYSMIIYGGGIYAGAILGSGLLSKNAEKLENKKVIVFGAGLTEMDPQQESSVIKRNFSEPLKSQIKFFFLKGNFDYSSLKLGDKIIMSFFKMNLKKKDPDTLSASEKAILENDKHPLSRARLENAESVITFAKKISE